jgi:hypothetical protein
MRSSDKQDLRAQQEVPVQERLQEQDTRVPTKKKTITVDFEYDTATGLIDCIDPKYMHMALLGKIPMKVARANHDMGRGEWTCG